MHKTLIMTLFVLSTTLLLTSCSDSTGSIQEKPQNNNNTSSQYPEEGTASAGFTLADLLLPTQPGTSVFESNDIIIDYSNAAYGYVSIKAPESTQKQKVQVILNDVTYTYDLVANEYVIVPLQMGDGSYTIRALRNVDGTSYSILASTNISVVLDDENSPYLYPNQIVDYDKDTKAVIDSFTLTENATSNLRRVYEIYTYITENITYDYDKAEVASTTFILPIIDETYISEKGICFDYAALMTAMLRAQHIPTRVITGMTDVGYHAWVEVYLEDQGWINPSIYFASDEWKRVDPTFDSMGEYDGNYQDQDRY